MTKGATLSKAEVEKYLSSVDLRSCLEGALNAAVAARAPDPPAFFRDHFAKLAASKPSGGATPKPAETLAAKPAPVAEAAAPAPEEASPASAPEEAAPAPPPSERAVVVADPPEPSPRSQAATPRAGAEEIDIIPIATKCFTSMAKMATDSMTPDMMRAMMTQLADSFTETVKWDVPVVEEHGKGSFEEMMNALGPIWDGISVTKAQLSSVTNRSETVAIVRTVYTCHIKDAAGNVIAGTEGDMEVNVSVRFRTDKIAQWHQEFDKEVLDAKRAVAAAGAPAEEAAEEEAAGEPEAEPAAAEGEKAAAEEEEPAAVQEEEPAAAEKEEPAAEEEPAADEPAAVEATADEVAVEPATEEEPAAE